MTDENERGKPADNRQALLEGISTDLLETLNPSDDSMGSGFLDETDRVFLAELHPELHDVQWGGKDRSNKRWRIRRKVKSVVRDFQFLTLLPREDIEQIFEDLDNTPRTKAQRDPDSDEYVPPVSMFPFHDQYHQLVDMLAFVREASQTHPEITFEELIERAVEQTEPGHRSTENGGQFARKVEADVNIDVDVEWVDYYDPEEIEAKIERGEGISHSELGTLFLSGHLSAEDYDQEELWQLIGDDETPPVTISDDS